jgi:hypothetical protein
VAEFRCVGAIVQNDPHRDHATTLPALRAAVAGRAVVEIAKGVLSEDHDLGMEEASARLRAYAHRQGRPLTDVARGIVSGDIPSADVLTPDATRPSRLHRHRHRHRRARLGLCRCTVPVHDEAHCPCDPAGTPQVQHLELRPAIEAGPVTGGVDDGWCRRWRAASGGARSCGLPTGSGLPKGQAMRTDDSGGTDDQ